MGVATINRLPSLALSFGAGLLVVLVLNRVYSGYNNIRLTRLFENNHITVKMHLYLSLINKTIRVTAVVFTSLLLSHCTSSPLLQQSPIEVRDIVLDDPPQASAPDRLNSKDTATPYIDENKINVERAEYYEQLANNQSTLIAQTDATLSAAEYYIQAGDYVQAEQAADSIVVNNLASIQLNRYSIIKAYVDYSRGQFDSALQRLASLINRGTPLLDSSLEQENSLERGNSFEQPNNSFENAAIENQTQKVDALLLSSFCYQQLNDYDSAISALIQRESLLVGNTRAETSRYTWQVINSLSTEVRQSIIKQTTNVTVRNRLEQSLDGQFAVQTPTPTQFDQWRDTTINQQKQTIGNNWSASSPQKIAVLLPLTSRFSKAALAVMDGIEYLHDANLSPYKPSIDFYDVGDSPNQISQYYSSISQMGYDLVLGPIGKDYANQLYSSAATQPYSRVPTILLGGDINLSNQPYNTFSRLTMSPEADGIEVANYAQRQGHVTAAMLVPNTETGQRTSQAFQQHWLNQGGNISKTIFYSPTQYDHSVELKQLFDINQSQSRYTKISNVLGFKPEFSAYRRSDVDFIFMIADNDAGRIVRPQIDFFSGKTVPVYSTSSIFNGIQDQANNLDLEETLFPVMPWILRSIDIAPYAGQLNMLFAMGSDAYLIASNYQTMRTNPELAISGNMGSLHFERSGDIIYQPIWAQFENGLAQGTTPLPNLEGINQLPVNSSQSTETGSNSYDDSNWDARRSGRKTGAELP